MSQAEQEMAASHGGAQAGRDIVNQYITSTIPFPQRAPAPTSNRPTDHRRRSRRASDREYMHSAVICQNNREVLLAMQHEIAECHAAHERNRKSWGCAMIGMWTWFVVWAVVKAVEITMGL